MDLLERVKKYQEFGISYNGIAKEAKISAATMKRFVKGESISEESIKKINHALHDIAILIYNIGFADEAKANEEWED